ncbi:hypothetical protein SAMD00020551_2263 [Mesobacillus selenatarsenatis SF-1]|uniref:Uncharacterized protein n=1 Tax=Mesobacillus selenatarsenatis (strain DSM 18680 / JCM 14380 / FERM P-15431 / SF-1) TaxID=1321606 RepID=A0A0A8X299_MESS1|nr:hypothetical protein SAMD00020551_2263 [Mesobacillus selenatarsenatis SF-1]
MLKKEPKLLLWFFLSFILDENPLAEATYWRKFDFIGDILILLAKK